MGTVEQMKVPRSKTVNSALPGEKKREPGAFRALLAGSRIIPAVRTLDEAHLAKQSRSTVVYLLSAAISTLDEYLHALHSSGKDVMVNLDLFSGLARDGEAVTYLARSGVSGVISTHAHVLQAAVAHDLFAIQRTFMLDSDSVDSSMRSLRRFAPDALELLPGPVAPRMLPRLRELNLEIATIAGGLITGLEEADEIVRAGIDAVSTGKTELWSI